MKEYEAIFYRNTGRELDTYFIKSEKSVEELENLPLEEVMNIVEFIPYMMHRSEVYVRFHPISWKIV